MSDNNNKVYFNITILTVSLARRTRQTIARPCLPNNSGWTRTCCLLVPTSAAQVSSKKLLWFGLDFCDRWNFSFFRLLVTRSKLVSAWPSLENLVGSEISLFLFFQICSSLSSVILYEVLQFLFLFLISHSTSSSSCCASQSKSVSSCVFW